MSRWQIRIGRLGALRGIAAVLMVFVYLLAGFAHNPSHLDIAKPSGVAVISVALDKAGDADEKEVLTGHHCHCCFAAAIPGITQAPQQSELSFSSWLPSLAQLNGRAPGTDTPPPKYLT